MIPKKPTPSKKSVEQFVGEAEIVTPMGQKEKSDGPGRGRPKGPEKGPLPVRLPVTLLEVIRQQCGGNLSYFTEKVFREYFEKNGVDIG